MKALAFACLVFGVVLVVVGVFSVNDGALVPAGIVSALASAWVLWGETADPDPRADRDREA